MWLCPVNAMLHLHMQLVQSNLTQHLMLCVQEYLYIKDYKTHAYRCVGAGIKLLFMVCRSISLDYVST